MTHRVVAIHGNRMKFFANFSVSLQNYKCKKEQNLKKKTKVEVDDDVPLVAKRPKLKLVEWNSFNQVMHVKISTGTKIDAPAMAKTLHFNRSVAV